MEKFYVRQATRGGDTSNVYQVVYVIYLTLKARHEEEEYKMVDMFHQL